MGSQPPCHWCTNQHPLTVVVLLHLFLQELLESGYLTEVHKFSKFIHGTCTLFPEMVQVRTVAATAAAVNMFMPKVYICVVPAVYMRSCSCSWCHEN